MLRRPLQIEQLAHNLPQSEEMELQLKRLQRLRENVDAVVFAVSNTRLAEDRRRLLLEILRKHQDALDDCLAEMGLTDRMRPAPAQPLWYFNQLDPVARRHLAAILGIPQEPSYYEVLDIKAEEYLAQCKAFEIIADELSFSESPGLARDANRPALILSLSGSLVQLSAPLSKNGARRYLYQNIYGNTHPPEGVLVLDRDIREGHRLRSVELTTSPVRLLRVMGRSTSWKAQSESFNRVARTLTSLVSRSSSQLVASGWINPQTGLQRKVNLEAAERVLREDYGETFSRYQQLRRRFIKGDTKQQQPQQAEQAEQQVEAELLTLCHTLQTAARELGFGTRTLDELVEFVTEGEAIYRVEPEPDLRVTLVSRGAGPDVVFSGISVGRQNVTRMAPLALIGGDGGLVEVTRPVIRFKVC